MAESMEDRIDRLDGAGLAAAAGGVLGLGAAGSSAPDWDLDLVAGAVGLAAGALFSRSAAAEIALAAGRMVLADGGTAPSPLPCPRSPAPCLAAFSPLAPLPALLPWALLTAPEFSGAGAAAASVAGLPAFAEFFVAEAAFSVADFLVR